MYRLIYYLYLRRFNFQKFDKLYLRLLQRIINKVLPILFKYIGKRNAKLIVTPKKNNLFIVSLTSFPIRIEKVWLVVESILRQKEKPDKIILWLYSGEFNGKESLPKNLLRLEQRGLEIRFCDENILPHKKYFFTMQEFPYSCIITIDDDMLFPPDLLYKLKKFHLEFPEAIICPITRKIRIKNNILRPYLEWPYQRINSNPSVVYLTMGGGGTLFPPNSLHNDVFDKKKLMSFALKADDLWLKIMSLRKQTKVVSIAGEYPRFFIPILNENDKRLMDSNIGEGNNDKIFNNLIKYYQIPTNVFIE